MERLPSRLGLLLGRLINYVSVGLLIFGITSFCRYLLPQRVGAAVTVVSWLCFAVCLCIIRIKANNTWTRVRSKHVKLYPELKDLIPDYWQIRWQDKSDAFALGRGEEWRSLQAFGLAFIALFLASVYERWRYPDVAPGFGNIWMIWLCMSFLVSSMIYVFSHDPSRKRQRGQYCLQQEGDDPDDYDPAGMGARIRQPSPVLIGGNTIPQDDQRYA